MLFRSDKGGLKVTKTTTGHATPDDTVFTVKNASGDVVASKKYSEFKAANSFTVSDLTPGIYTVEESGAEVTGYTLVVSENNTAELAKDQTAEIRVTNTYTRDKGSLKVTKTTTGNTTPDDTVFTVTNASGDVVATQTYKEFKEAGYFEVTDLPTGTYTVTESGAEIVNYTLEVTGDMTAEVSKGQQAEIALTNKYTEDKGGLKVTKTTDRKSVV